MQEEKRQQVNFSIYLLAAILFLLPLDSALGGLVGAISLIDYIVVIFLFVHILTNANVIFKKRKANIIFLPLIYAVVSIIWSRNKASLSNLMYLSYLVLFIILFNTEYNSIEKQLISKSVFGSVFLLIAFTLFFGEFYQGRLSININGYIDPNYFCTGFVILVSVLLLNISNNNYRIISLICLCAVLSIVFLSGSRGSLLAILAEIICYFLFKNRKHFAKIIILFGVMFFCGLIVYFILPDSLVSRFNILNSIKNDGGSGRLVIWENMFTIYKNGSLFTKIFGFGRESCIVLYKDMVGINYTPHNIYIKILLEFGVVGLFLVVVCFIKVLKWTINNNNHFLFAILVGISVGALFLDMDNTRVIWFIILFLSKQDLINIKLDKVGGKKKYVVKHSYTSL